jgi:hypothetical protein
MNYRQKIAAKLNKKADGSGITAYKFITQKGQGMLLLVDSNGNGVFDSGEPKSPEEVKYTLDMWNKNGGFETKEFSGTWDLSDSKEARDAVTLVSTLFR